MLQGQPWSAPACTRVLVRSPSGEYVTPKDAINSVINHLTHVGFVDLQSGECLVWATVRTWWS